MKKRVEEIINEIRENKGEKKMGAIKDESRLREDIGFDSFDLAELTVKIESEFGIDVFESGVIRTYGELKRRLEE